MPTPTFMLGRSERAVDQPTACVYKRGSALTGSAPNRCILAPAVGPASVDQVCRRHRVLPPRPQSNSGTKKRTDRWRRKQRPHTRRQPFDPSNVFLPGLRASEPCRPAHSRFLREPIAYEVPTARYATDCRDSCLLHPCRRMRRIHRAVDSVDIGQRGTAARRREGNFDSGVLPFDQSFHRIGSDQYSVGPCTSDAGRWRGTAHEGAGGWRLRWRG